MLISGNKDYAFKKRACNSTKFFQYVAKNGLQENYRR